MKPYYSVDRRFQQRLSTLAGEVVTTHGGSAGLLTKAKECAPAKVSWRAQRKLVENSRQLEIRTT
jgi:hypothetical protein